MEEKFTEELSQLKKINRELNAIIENFYDAIVVTDGRGTVILVNKAYERITGLETSELLGKNIKKIVAEGILSESSTLKVFKTKKTSTVVQKIKTGKTMLVTGVPIFDDNGLIYRVVSSCRDLTDLNELKEKLEESKRLSNKYYHEVTKLRAQQLELEDIIAQSPQMEKVVETALRVAEVDSNVIILGESGVGKEIVAKLVHKHSHRKKGPFIKVSCGSIPENLLESELYGYEEGAFTGASKGGKVGTFELADEGTLFLDEVGELPLNLQVKLLSSTQEKAITRVGGTELIDIDIRIIAATNRDLYTFMQQGHFRSDLYFRLSVINIHVPPLRERSEDIFPLAMFFLNKFNRQYGFNKRILPGVFGQFYKYPWPGNVRELENVMERLVVLSEGDVITTESLEDRYRSDINIPICNDYIDLEEEQLPTRLLSDYEKELIATLYKKYGSTRKVASILGINQSTVARKLKKYDLNAK